MPIILAPRNRKFIQPQAAHKAMLKSILPTSTSGSKLSFFFLSDETRAKSDGLVLHAEGKPGCIVRRYLPARSTWPSAFSSPLPSCVLPASLNASLEHVLRLMGNMLGHHSRRILAILTMAENCPFTDSLQEIPTS